MKKIYFLLVLVSCRSFSQDAQISTTAYTTAGFVTTDKIIPEETSTVNVLLKKNGAYIRGYRNNIPSAILSDFTRKYESAENANWKVDDHEVTCIFNFNGQKIIVAYKKNGYLLSTRKTYDSSKLHKTIKPFIRSEMDKGYRISLVTEVVSDAVTLYEISLTGQSKICIVRVSRNKDGEPVLDEKIFYINAENENSGLAGNR